MFAIVVEVVDKISMSASVKTVGAGAKGVDELGGEPHQKYQYPEIAKYTALLTQYLYSKPKRTTHCI